MANHDIIQTVNAQTVWQEFGRKLETLHSAQRGFAKPGRLWLVAATMKPASAQPTRNLRRTLMLRWLALWPLTFGLLLYPVSNRAIRIATVVMILLLWLGMLWFVWSAKWLRMIVIGIPVIVIAFVFLPGHKTDRLALRDEYLDSLRSFDGTRYVWGGENRLGIDCSGLVRAALINASLRDSVATLNPSSLRLAVDLWWHDSSAKALGEEYRHQTILVSAAGAINEIASDSLQPGDLAVTEDGVHVLAFLDDTHWIEADPDEKKVIIVSVPSSNAWFSTPVKIVRWRPLDGAVQSSSGNEP